MVGCPNDTYDSVSDAGAVYIYDRSVQRFIVTDDTQTVYTVNTALVAPTSVILNNQFLVNTDGRPSGDFTVTDVDEITLTVPAEIGDILEIEVNTFDLLQIVGADQASEGANFGQAVDLCINDCSLYTGAPQDSSVAPEAGSVERQVNQSRVYGITTSTINATLTPGNTIRINNMEVELSTPTA